MLDCDLRTLIKHLPAHHGVWSPNRPSQADRAERYQEVGFQGALLQVQLQADPLQLLPHRDDVLLERQVVVLTVHIDLTVTKDSRKEMTWMTVVMRTD